MSPATAAAARMRAAAAEATAEAKHADKSLAALETSIPKMLMEAEAAAAKARAEGRPEWRDAGPVPLPADAEPATWQLDGGGPLPAAGCSTRMRANAGVRRLRNGSGRRACVRHKQAAARDADAARGRARTAC
jgi:hypothetical protein